MNKKNAKNVILIGIILIMFSICTIQLNKINLLQTSVSAEDNKTIGWGIKRNNNHQQPDVGVQNRSILEQNGGIDEETKDKIKTTLKNNLIKNTSNISVFALEWLREKYDLKIYDAELKIKYDHYMNEQKSSKTSES